MSQADPRFGPLRRSRDLALVVGIAFALRLVFMRLIDDTYDYDEFVLLFLARDVAAGAVPYHDFLFFHPPGALEIFRVIEPLTRIWWPAARIFTAFVDAITAGLVFAVATTIWDRRAAVAAGLVYAASPLALVSADRVGQDPLVTMLGVAGLLLLLRYQSWAAAVGAGACVGFAIWIKYPAAYFLPIYVLAAPRRAVAAVAGAAATVGVALAPFSDHAAALYQQTVSFQSTRWYMDASQRLATTAVWWLANNAPGIVGAGWLLGHVSPSRSASGRRAGTRKALLDRRYAALERWYSGVPIWLPSGFLLGIVFLAPSQVYYHYFVPVVPFGALLAGPFLAHLLDRRVAATLASVGLVVTVGFAAFLTRSGTSPLYVTAARLSALAPALRLVANHDPRKGPILADRYEYAYLSGTPATAHYFWNVGVLVDTHYLVHHFDHTAVVILSHGASSGYPAGFTSTLRCKQRIETPEATVWFGGPCV